MMRNKLLLSLSVSLFFSINSYACSCEYFKRLDLRQYNQYYLVFKGTVLSIIQDQKSSEKEVTYLVNKVYKGTVDTDTVRVRSGLDAGSCGLEFKVGQTWMIFSSGSKEVLYTGLCTRSKLLNLNPKTNWRAFIDKQFLKKYRTYSGIVSNTTTYGELSNGKPVGSGHIIKKEESGKPIIIQITECYMAYLKFTMTKA